MTTRGIRGAINVESDQADQVLDATMELLNAILAANPGLESGDIASVFFTVTEDINSVHPALGARKLGWCLVPMLCAKEIPVPGSLPRCIRVLVHWNTDRAQESICHVYLREAVALRPDLSGS